MEHHEDIAARKLYELMAQQFKENEPKDRDWVPTPIVPWEKLSEDQRQGTRDLVRIVTDNSPAPLSGELRIRWHGYGYGTEPIVRLYRSDVTPESIDAACADLAAWLKDLAVDLAR